MKPTLSIISMITAVALGTNAWAADDGSKPADMSKPLQVFLIMGQSNAFGMGNFQSLEKAVKEKKKYPYLIDSAGAWVERKDVRFVQYMSGKGMLRNEFLVAKPGNVGIEYGVGHALGNTIDAPVMILKCAIGNRSLGWDLLPPGSARFEEGDKVYAGYKDSPDSWPKGTEPKPINWYAGKQYDDDVANAKKAISDLATHYPGATKVEVAGFFFWQGEKDAYSPVNSARYEQNLVNFIRSVRKDFNAPKAKFVLATMGEATKDMTNNTGKVLAGHLAVDGESGKYPEFKGNVATVYTHDMAQGGGGNGHYGGNSEVYMDVGEAMGKSMCELLKK
jgi:Carbohydrate esterase, sialic acid-specific acetylesterase